MIHTILCVDTLGATAAPMLAMLLDYEIERANKKRAELGAPALQVEVISAGTYEGADKDFDPSSLHEATLQCMADFSIDQTAQRPHRIMSLPLMRFDMIVCIGVDALNFVSRRVIQCDFSSV